MSKLEFVELFEKFQEGRCTPEEINLLENFKDDFMLEKDEWTPDMGTKAAIRDEIFTRLSAETGAPAETRNLRLNYRWIAAAAAIVIVSSLAYLFYPTADRQPVTQENVLLSTRFSTLAGEKKQITLQDGTVVWLNAKSTLILANDFNDSTRNVDLVGEAYFDVSHKKDRPFKVHTDDFDIKVLGTAFNVKSYPGEATAEATLIRGAIHMKPADPLSGSIILKPSQKATFFRSHKYDDRKTVKSQILLDNYVHLRDSVILETAWTSNRLEIYDQKFGELRPMLERWFNTKIIFKSKAIEHYRFTATFNNESLKTVLNAFQTIQHFNYEIKDNYVIISE